MSSHVDASPCLLWQVNMLSRVAPGKRLTVCSRRRAPRPASELASPLVLIGGAEGDKYHGSMWESEAIRMETAPAPRGGEGG